MGKCLISWLIWCPITTRDIWGVAWTLFCSPTTWGDWKTENVRLKGHICQRTSLMRVNPINLIGIYIRAFLKSQKAERNSVSRGTQQERWDRDQRHYWDKEGHSILEWGSATLHRCPLSEHFENACREWGHLHSEPLAHPQIYPGLSSFCTGGKMYTKGLRCTTV